MPRRAAESAPPLATAGAPIPEDATVLVVEDNPVVLHLVVRSLERAGFRVVATTDSTEAEALAEAAEGRIDLLLTDVVMPVMQGPEVAAQVRALYPELPVLFMSAYTPGSGTHDDTLAPDAQRLNKPFSPAELVGRVQALIEEARASRGAT